MRVSERIRLRLKANDQRLLDQSTTEVVDTAKRTGAHLAARLLPDTVRNRYTLLRSPVSGIQIRAHKRLLDILEPTQNTLDALMKLDLPSGVSVEIKSFGRDRLFPLATSFRASIADAPSTEGADLIQKALTIIGSPDRLAQWMRTPIPALQGRVPYSLLDSEDGRRQVEIVLGRIEHGIY